MKLSLKQTFILMLIAGIPLYASSGGYSDALADLVIQIGIIIICAKFAGMLFIRLNMPSVLGELIAGVIIGPYMLGSLSIPGFAHGLFPLLNHGQTMPVSSELYSIATIASILLLFIAGMETDLEMFLKFSVKGSLIGISGVIFSFLLGAVTTSVWFHKSIMDPVCLFMGVLSTATSVGITARILSDNKKTDTPEGVTILSAAVIDDVIGIILLAIIVAIAGSDSSKDVFSLNWYKIGIIAVKAISIWLGATLLGMLFSSRISRFLKRFKSVSAFSIIALALSFLLSGYFEKGGLAMIIGAYVMGLTLSKTDITYVIREELHSIYNFFVPVFFTVMGMMVNMQNLFSPSVLIFGLIFTLIASFAKIFGCGFPALFVNFNMLGATRIGMGMVPRGEVALIIAGIGLSSGILDSNFFSISILMTLITTLIPPPLLSMLVRNPKKGTRKDMKGFDTTTTEYSFPSSEVRELIVSKIITEIESEGFFVSKMELDEEVYHMRKDDVFFSMSFDQERIMFNSDKADVSFIKTAVYESLLSIHDTIEKLKALAKPDTMRKDLTTEDARIEMNIFKILTKNHIIPYLIATDKEGIIREMIDKMSVTGVIVDKNEVFSSVMAREAIMSTGMQDGIALPHGKTDTGITHMSACLGIKREGIDFDSLDGKPSTIFVLLLSGKTSANPHLQFLSTISAILGSEDIRNQLVTAATTDRIWDILNNANPGKI